MPRASCVLEGDLQDRFDALELSWLLAGEPGRPHLVAKLRARTPGEVIRVMFGGDSMEARMRLDPEDPEWMRARFSELLNPYLQRPALLRDLPIPGSAAPASQEAFPRPASAPAPAADNRPIPSGPEGAGR